MNTFVYVWNLAADEQRRAMRRRQGPAQELLATNVQGTLDNYRARMGADEDRAREWFATGMARHWAWNVADVWGIAADGPFSAVAFK